MSDIMELSPENPTIMSDKFVARQQGRKCLVDSFDRKASSLSSMEYVKNGRQGDYVKCPEGYRKLTPIECERLQGVDDNYTNHVSNTQRYRMLGNGWQVTTIEHIFSSMGKPINNIQPSLI